MFRKNIVRKYLSSAFFPTSFSHLKILEAEVVRDQHTYSIFLGCMMFQPYPCMFAKTGQAYYQIKFYLFIF